LQSTALDVGGSDETEELQKQQGRPERRPSVQNSIGAFQMEEFAPSLALL
jgi:hypothetical protein